MEHFKFSKMDITKLSISFTWDDNFECHYKKIAPLFCKYNNKCTFFINPGENNFSTLQKGYLEIANNGFEIGSHGFTHHHFSRLIIDDYRNQLTKSKEDIYQLIRILPTTFAFPHHDYTLSMLEEAKKIYLETRNTLYNSIRISLKTQSNIYDIQSIIDQACKDNKNIVFSGHGIIDEHTESSGYEPISLEFLENILQLAQKYRQYEINTFLEASIKSYIKNQCAYTSEQFTLTNDQIEYLNVLGITLEGLKKTI